MHRDVPGTQKAPQGQNTKRIRREHHANTMRIRREYQSASQAPGYPQAGSALSAPSPLRSAKSHGPITHHQSLSSTPWSAGWQASAVQLLQHGAESREPGHGHAGPSGLAQWFQEQALQLQRLAALEVDQGRGPVSAHRPGAFDLLVGESVPNVEPQSVRGGDDFQHQLAHQLRPAGVGQKLVGGEERRSEEDPSE